MICSYVNDERLEFYLTHVNSVQFYYFFIACFGKCYCDACIHCIRVRVGKVHPHYYKKISLHTRLSLTLHRLPVAWETNSHSSQIFNVCVVISCWLYMHHTVKFDFLQIDIERSLVLLGKIIKAFSVIHTIIKLHNGQLFFLRNKRKWIFKCREGSKRLIFSFTYIYFIIIVKEPFKCKLFCKVIIYMLCHI